MDKYLSKTMTLHSLTGCYINVNLYQRYIIISQVSWATYIDGILPVHGTVI